MLRRSTHTIAIPPGATIREQLEILGMIQKEFAARMSMTEKHISRLINGEVKLKTEVALSLETVLGVPASFWLKLEAIYREKCARIEEENNLESELEIAKKIPYAEMVKLGWVPSVKKNIDKVFYLRKFFETVNLDYVLNGMDTTVAFRRLAETEKSNYAVLAWIQKAKLESRRIETDKINIKKLKNRLSQIRSMTIKNPDEFCPQLEKMLAECGITVVWIPHISGSYLQGATFIDNKKIVLGMILRGKDSDRFWFSLFHELGHIIYNHISKSKTTDEEEKLADKFARDTLIEPEDYNSFKSKYSYCYTETCICNFAKSIGIEPGIVVGRLQSDSEIERSWFNGLKNKYEFG